MLHKILHKKIDIPLSILPNQSRDGAKFQQKIGRILAYTNSFVPTATKWWNKLPTDLRKITKEDIFRTELIEHFKKN